MVAGHYMHVITKTLGHTAAEAVRKELPDWMRSEARPIIDQA